MEWDLFSYENGILIIAIAEYIYFIRPLTACCQTDEKSYLKPLSYFNAVFRATERNVRLHNCLMSLSVGLLPSGAGKLPNGVY
jgi:hypothetical protein